MLRHIRESLIFALIALLPLHALLVTVGTRLLVGAGQAPLLMLAMWKEAILVIVILIAVLECTVGRNSKHQIPRPTAAGRANSKRIPNLKFQMDILDWLIVGLVFLGVLIPSSNFIYGFKYTLFPLCLFVILRRVTWSEEFVQRAFKLIVVVGGVVAGYGILTFFLPMEFFTWLGYSDLHSLYLPDGPLAAFQQIGGTGVRRIQSTMSGPNQLGIWLLIPLSVLISRWMQKFPSPGGGGLGRGDMSNDEFHLFSDPLPLAPSRREGGKIVFLIIFFLALFLTFSRAAWIGATVMVLFVIYRSRVSKIAAAVGGGIVVLGILAFWNPDVLIRSFSSRGHIERPIAAIQTIIAHPLGLGLGSAGPASNRVSDSCVFLEPGSDPSWATDRPDLCVFVGDNQVQPVGETCQCPFLPENCYLQVGVELGLLGFVLFISLVIFILLRTQERVRLMFLGVSIAALFLHAWEDAAVAYTVWILVAMMPPCTKGASLSSTLGASTRT